MAVDQAGVQQDKPWTCVSPAHLAWNPNAVTGKSSKMYGFASRRSSPPYLDGDEATHGRRKQLVKLLVNMIMATNLQGCDVEKHGSKTCHGVGCLRRWQSFSLWCWWCDFSWSWHQKWKKLQSTIKFGKHSEKHIFREMMVRFAATLVVERFLKKMQIRNATQWWWT